MRDRILFVFLFLTFSAVVFVQSPNTAGAKTAAAEQQNPSRSTPEAQVRAKKLYGYDCAVCHGENGDGKGDMAGDYPGKIRDWTNPDSLKEFTDDQLFTIIKDGKGDMPPEGKRAKASVIRELVYYVRSFAKDK